MILVVGGTGEVGGEVCRRLRTAERPVRALLRSTEGARVEELRAMGVDLAQGDLTDVSSLSAACSGATGVVTTVTSVSSGRGELISSVDRRGQIALVDAARAAGVERLVYVSFSHGLELESPLRDAKRAVEDHLVQSGMEYTILAPTFFMEVWLSPALGFDPENGAAQVYGDGTSPISWISATDVAQYAAACVDGDAARNRSIELGGPEAVSPLEVVRRAETVVGREIAVTHAPEEALQAQYEAATDPLQRTFAALMLGYAGGDVIDMASTLERIPARLRSVDEHLRETFAS